MTLEVLMREAAAAFAAGDAERAEPLLRQIVGHNPRDAQAWHALALIACRSGRASEAFDCAIQAHKLDKRNALYLNTVGVTCVENGRLEESLRWFRRALKEKADNAETHYNVAKVLRRLEQYGAAERAYRSALQIEPSMVDAANNLASLYIRSGRLDEAYAMLERARVLLPDAATVAINTAIVLLARRGPSAAIEHLEAFLQQHADAAEAHFELALRLLADGRFAEGWREYAWRHRVPGAERPPGLAQALPLDLRGRTIVLVPDQGLGDQLFFLRFAAILRERGATVMFASPDNMVRMLAGAPELDGLIEAQGSALPELADAIMALLGDLPRLLESEATPPPFAIAVPPERISMWRERLAALGPPPYLGVTWRAGSKKQVESGFAPAGLDALYKEIDVEALARAVRGWPGTLLVLQRLPAAGEVTSFSRAVGRKAHDLSALNEQLPDMAAVLAVVEEYAGVSSTNMHIRAGVAKSARVLVPFPSEFRWMHAGDRSPWFRGFRVYRQSASLDWTEALRQLSNDLST